MADDDDTHGEQPCQPLLISREEARAKGLKRYRDGKACKHGHVDERYTTNGACVLCAVAYANAAYAADPDKVKEQHKAKRKADPEGARIRARTYYAANAHKKKAAEKARREKNIEETRARDRARYQANIEKRRAAARAYGVANREKKRADTKAWREANPERAKAALDAWAKANPEALRAHWQNRRARVKNAEGFFTKEDVLRLYEQQKCKCANCGKSIKKGYEVDHIVPLAKGGTNWPTNLQLLCRSCNARKHAKDPYEWARENGRLI